MLAYLLNVGVRVGSSDRVKVRISNLENELRQLHASLKTSYNPQKRRGQIT